MHDTSADRNPLDPLAEEFVARFRAGERPSLTEYATRHPELADDIRELFPALVEMEQLKPVSADCTGAFVADIEESDPDRIGEFRILRRVGRGGMGVVYEAVQESLGRHVALKVLPAEALIDPKLRERFRRETRAAARLHHTNIVPVFGTGEADGRHFYAMQFIAGHPLDAVIDEVRRLREKSGVAGRATEAAHSLLTGTFGNGLELSVSPRPESSRGAPASAPLEDSGRGETGSSSHLAGQTQAAYPRAVARVGAQVADALAYAHGQGILHRDIKPSNLLLDHRGTVWVTDFGLAKSDDLENLTQSGDVVGTVRYMAPERFRGECDARADVYALGLTLYELLTLRPAFDTSNRLKQIDQIAHRDPPRPRARDPRIPHDLETIVMKAIDKDPARRYPSAADVAADLRHFLADEPITARRMGPAERLVRWARRNPVMASLSAAIVLVTVCGFAATAAQARAAQDERNTAREQRDDAQQQRDEVRAVNEQLQATQAQLRGTLYAAHMNLAHHAWEATGPERVRDLLTQHQPKPGESDLRGFEWYYLNRLSHAETLTLKGHAGSVQSATYSPDGKRLASASFDKTVKVWDAQTGQELLTLKGHTSGVNSVAYSPDGKRLASASQDLMAKVWDAQTGQELLTLKGHTGRLWSVVFSLDGKRLASASQDQTAKVWDAQTGQELLTLKGHTSLVYSVAFSPDGKRLASGSPNPDGSVKVWDAQTGQELLSVKGGGDTVAFSPDGKRLASAPGDNTVKVWDAQTGQELLSLKGHTAGITSVAFSPDGKHLASATLHPDRTAKVWDAQTGQELLTLKGHTGPVYSVAFSPDGKRLISAGRDGTVKVWDAHAGRKPLTLKAGTSSVAKVAFSPDGKRLASGSMDPLGSVNVWDAQTGQELLTLKDGCRSVAFSPDGKRLASASPNPDGTVKVWDAQTGQELLSLKGRFGSVAFSPDGKRLASGGEGEVKLWDAQTGQELLSLKGHTGGVWGVTFSPDGKRLASAGGRDGTVKVWEAQSGQELLTLKGHTGAVTSVAFSPDGKRLASGSHIFSFDQPLVPDEVKVWDAQTGQELLTLKGHTHWVESVAFSPDGKRLASCSPWELKVWDAQTGQELLTLKSGGRSVAFSPDGYRLACGGEGGTVTIWDATPLPEK